MTMPPPPAYGALWGSLDTTAQAEVLKDVAKDGTALLLQMIEALREGLPLRKARPAERLAWYQKMTPEMLQRLHDAYPRRYDELMEDWYAILERDQSSTGRAQLAPAGDESGPAVVY